MSERAITFRYVYEGGKHYVVIAQGGTQDFLKLELDPRQVSGFIQDALPRVIIK